MNEGMVTAGAVLRRAYAPLTRSWRMRTWVLWFPLCALSSLIAVVTWDVRRGGTDLTGMGVWVIGLLGASALQFRRKWPVRMVLGLAAMTLALPLDPMAMLVAYGSLTVRRIDRAWVALTAVVLATTGVSVWRDGQGRRGAESFWQGWQVGAYDPNAPVPVLSLTTVSIISAVLVTVTAGVALIVRQSAHARSARAEVDAQSQVVGTLTDQLARQAERERIAREVHDALGHRLSMLSLHAGALEVAASSDDPQTAESAALVRANAQQSMADLRHLLATLHTPDAPDVAANVPALRDVPELVEETIAAGVVVISTVQFDSIDRLDQQTSRSAYRLVQELLTNARRHAPGSGVRLLVRAGPKTGVEIETVNRLLPNAPAHLRPGHGLTGAATRVEQLGGQWRCWVDDQRVVRAAAQLPWVWDEPEVTS